MKLISKLKSALRIVLDPESLCKDAKICCKIPAACSYVIYVKQK